MANTTRRHAIEEFRLQSIREAATRVLARQGFAGTTMQEIADEAQIAKGTLYLYFKDKEDLLASVVDFSLEKLRAEVDHVFEQKLGVEQTLRLVTTAQFSFFEEHGELFRVYHELTAVGGSSRRRDCDPHYQKFLDLLAAMFKRAMAKGEIRRANPEALAIFVAEGTIGIIVRRIGEGRRISIKDEVELVVGTVLRGLLPGRRSE
ncbi:MAG: TetR/AcrR family transcriptional regulator [Thermoanaerobaculia bacterium]|nr:TetR/AcrR family transcriptional regulator [Thermoanaerobaculia bacterium]